MSTLPTEGVKTVQAVASATGLSGGPTARSMLTSFAVHTLAVILLLLVPAEALRAQKREVDVSFYRPEPAAVPAPVAKAPLPLGPGVGPKPPGPAPVEKPIPKAPPGPKAPGNPELPPGPVGPPQVTETARERVGKTGILALKDQFASLAKDKITPKLGADARLGEADDKGNPSSRTLLATSTPGSSGGINVAALSRSVGGGGGGGGGKGGGPGGGGGGAGGGGGGGQVVSPIAGIGGGDRPLAHGGPGPSRTDEEIQIVFDRYKAQFYRLYNRALRNDPTLKGQMVLRLTIEPDGSVSMCKLQSSDMNAPELADQVVGITKTINFGAKEGVQALTISYPIDFLPAE